MTPVVEMGANWISVMPYAYGASKSPKITHNTNWQWWGETTRGTRATIQQAKEKGLKVMLKPHVWIRGEGWCGDFYCKNEADWKKWEEAYLAYILPLAVMAEELSVELICIGTEYRKAVQARPDFWKHLIREIRKVYSGKLTYAQIGTIIKR